MKVMLGRSWVESIAESALRRAEDKNIPENHFHCLLPQVFDGGKNKSIYWQFRQCKRIETAANRISKIVIFEPDEYLRKNHPSLLKWSEIYGLARALLDHDNSLEEDALLSIEIERRLATAERYEIDGMKGGRQLNEPLLSYIHFVVDSLMQDKG